MNRRSLFLLFLLLIFSGCNSLVDSPFDHSLIEREVYLKEELKESFLYSESVIPIETFDNEYIQVLDWFDDSHVIFMTELNGVSYLRTHNILTGEQFTFFESNDPILAVKANKDYSFFAVTIGVSEADTSPLLILDNKGVLRHEVSGISDEFILYWNPYNTDQILIVEFLPDWEFEVYHLRVNEKTLTELDIKQTYFQWLDKNTLAYQNWSWLEPSFTAPLISYNLKTKDKLQLLDEIIAFFTFSNDVYVTLSVDTIYDLNTKYTFYREQREVNEIEIPILDTFSEQWWIPFHDYSKDRDTFFYLRPLYSGTFIDYKDPYELTAFQVEKGKETVIMEVGQHSPIKASPNGKWLLYGHQFEEVIDIAKRKNYTLIDF